MNSRRNFIKKSSLITLGALNYNFSPIIKDINGIDISVITYSFNPGVEDMNVIIQNCIYCHSFSNLKMQVRFVG